jgi:hypothetical protein
LSVWGFILEGSSAGSVLRVHSGQSAPTCRPHQLTCLGQTPARFINYSYIHSLTS